MIHAETCAIYDYAECNCEMKLVREIEFLAWLLERRTTR